MKTLLITGGAGFIGSCLVRRLVAGGAYRVVNLDKLTYAGNLDSLSNVEGSQNYVFVNGDIADVQLVREIFRSYQPTGVINLAAESHVDRSIDSPAEFVQTNVVGTCKLLQASLHYWEQLASTDQQDFRFLHVSTDEVFGSLGSEGKFSETTTYSPNSPYSASKASADHFVRAFHKTYGLPTLLTNCSNNYGPYQFPEKLIPLMILNALSGKSLPVYGDGKQIRDWLHVEDHCRAFESVLERGTPGEVYLVGADNEQTNMDIVRMICDAVDKIAAESSRPGCADLIEHVADRPGHDRRYAIDATKLRTELGWRPTIAFDAGIEATVRWYVENRDWVERVASGVYRQRQGLREASARQ